MVNRNNFLPSEWKKLVQAPAARWLRDHGCRSLEFYRAGSFRERQATC
jgi:hypothetical protein